MRGKDLDTLKQVLSLLKTTSEALESISFDLRETDEYITTLNSVNDTMRSLSSLIGRSADFFPELFFKTARDACKHQVSPVDFVCPICGGHAQVHEEKGYIIYAECHTCGMDIIRSRLKKKSVV